MNSFWYGILPETIESHHSIGIRYRLVGTHLLRNDLNLIVAAETSIANAPFLSGILLEVQQGYVELTHVLGEQF